MGKASNSKKTRADKIAATGYGKKGFNWFPIISTAFAVVAIVAVLIVTVFANQKALEPSVAPTSNVTLPADIATTINQENGSVTIGTADNKMEEYIDFGCPYCGDYHRNHGEDVRGFVADGKIALSIFPLALLDRAFQGTEFSTRAANSFYCVAEKDPNSVLDYVANLYANQPKEGTKGLTDDELVKIAANSGAGNTESCIREQTYKDFVTQTTRKANANDWLTGTPTIRLNEKIVDYNSIVNELKAL